MIFSQLATGSMVSNRDAGKAKSCVKEFSPRFIIFSFGLSALLAFELGKIASSTIIEYRRSSKESSDNSWETTFPVPKLIEGKVKPDCLSINRYFDSSFTVSSLFLDTNDDDNSSNKDESNCKESDGLCSLDEEGKYSLKDGDVDDEEEEEDDDDDDDAYENEILKDDEEHLPAGQHLLVDVINVDKDFLSSEVRLARAMMQVVNQSKLTLLSYHCYSHVGVSCVGVLLESHIAFHTWPDKGVITLDLFTCGSGKLVPLMPLIEELFVVPQVISDAFNVVKKPFVNWSHKLRGFRTKEQKDYIFRDIGHDFYGASHMAEKKEIASTTTNFQRFDVVDHFDNDELSYGSYLRSLTDDGSYESQHPELYRLERTVFLDGVMQSSRTGIEAYHEALVHPAMIAHDEPRRVAIIGGGECATLREVLKHKTVEQVTMIEIDEIMVEMSRRYLPDWSDCSDLVGSADWCGDDDRADLYYEDALAWFNDRFSESSQNDASHNEDPYDILIMDALDPEDDVPFADVLYTSNDFFKTLYNSLSEDGIIVFQLGCSPDHDDAPQEESPDFRRAYLAGSLEGVGFKSVHIYEESHARFGDPWSFLVAMKNSDGPAVWGRNLAEINIDIHNRILRTHSGNPALKHFDGSTMEGYRVPSIVFQAAFCKKIPTPTSCVEGVLKRRKNIPISSLEVRTSEVEGGGRGVFAKVDLEKGSYIDLTESAKKVHFTPSMIDVLWDTVSNLPEIAKNLTSVYHYADGYGWQTMGKGSEEYFVDSGLITFVNHGCNGTYNVDDVGYDEMTEQNTDFSKFFSDDRDVYDIFLDRHYLQSNNAASYTLRDIKAGEEILANYLTFCEQKHDWIAEMTHLKQVCNKEATGDISEWEQAATKTS